MSFKGMLGRGAAGAAVGGYMGWGDGTRGRIGGAAAGALAGMGGGWAGRKLYGMNNMAGRGLRAAGGYAGQGAGWLGGKISSGANRLSSNIAIRAMNPNAIGMNAASRGAGMLGRFGAGMSTNKYGGTAMLGLGMGSAGYIGSSMLSSNGGY